MSEAARAVVALAAKDLRLLWRQPGELFFVLAWPVLLAVLFGVIFAVPPEGRAPLAVALVDEDGSEGSRAFAQGLERAGGVTLLRSSRDEAAAGVRQGRQLAWVALRPGFGAAAANPFGAAAPVAELGIDPSRPAEAALLEGLLAREAAQQLQQRLGDREANRRLVADALARLRHAPSWSAERRRNERFLRELDVYLSATNGEEAAAAGPRLAPLRVERQAAAAEGQGPRRSFDFTFPQGILWGLLACAANFATSLVAERTRGTLQRLLAAPISRAQVLAGKALACFAAMLAVEALLVLLGVTTFGVRPSSWPWLAAAGVSSAVAFTGLMMVLAALCATEQSANGAAWGTLLVLALLGGGMVPLFVMPAWMLAASRVSPARWAILALEGALWRGFTPAEMALPCSVLLAVGGAGLALGTRLFRAH